MIGLCGCGEPGCGSLWVQVRREEDTVVWEPDPTSPRSTVDRTFRFSLVPYLDALDRGRESMTKWETRSHLFARELRRQRDSLFGFGMGSTRRGTTAELHSARARSNSVEVTIAAWSGISDFSIPLAENRTEAEIITALKELGTEAAEHFGRATT